MTEIFDDSRQYREKNNGDDNQREVIFDKSDVAEIISAENKYTYPGYPADNIVSKKS